MNNLQVDQDGVPNLIQYIRYSCFDMSFTVGLFNSSRLFRFTTDSVCQSMGLMQNGPDKMQQFEAEYNIEKIVLAHWSDFSPKCEVVRLDP